MTLSPGEDFDHVADAVRKRQTGSDFRKIPFHREFENLFQLLHTPHPCVQLNLAYTNLNWEIRGVSRGDSEPQFGHLET